MNSKTISICAVAFLLTITQLIQASANSKNDVSDKDCKLKVHLPREAKVKNDIIRLGQISIIRGEESVVAKAREVSLGQLAMPGQEIVINKTTVLSRLACSDIPASKVTLTGAEMVTVKQQSQVIKGDKFIEMALSFLQKKSVVDPNCQLSPVRIPKNLFIPGADGDIKFSLNLIAGTRNQVKVQITALANGKELGVRQVTFNIRYNHRKAVTMVDIPANTTLTHENIKIVKTLSNYPEPANWTAPYGLVAKRRLPANTVVRSHMAGPVEPPVIVHRNQNVVVRIEKPGLLLTTTGKATQNGRVGDYIKVKVQITDTPRIIITRVKEDGSVEPVL